jgi:tRNA modification GTPase
VLELQGHGGPVVLDNLLARAIELGARLARPGEFSERAFLNGKLDLAQAEAIADLIDAGSTTAARAALRSLDGEFSRRVHLLTESLVALRTHVEAAIDFPEEEIDFLADTRIATSLDELLAACDTLQRDAHQGALLRDGLTVVIAGPPNAGKSSLLNALAQRDVAIVSAVPGTTRDVLRERIAIDGMPLHIMDTAGLRTATEEVEAEGVRRARDQLARADLALFVSDASAADTRLLGEARAQLPAGLRCVAVRNKIDLTGEPPAVRSTERGPEVALSVKTGDGLELLREQLRQAAGLQPAGEGSFSARRRHLEALARARQHLQQAATPLGASRAGELLAEELRLAQQALGEITGEFTADDLLGRIFADFCIGK